MAEFVNISDFMNHLKQNDLVIVSRQELLEQEHIKVALIRDRIERKRWLTIKEIVDAELLPVRTKQAVLQWIKTERIKPKYVSKNDAGVIKIHKLFLQDV